MDVIRTPEASFDNLLDYNFDPHYFTLETDSGTALRMHYLDENTLSDEVVLLLHGEPTWSYLYRKFIPPLISKGKRVIAPDLIGFGKSDKLTDQKKYSYKNHLNWTLSLIKHLEIKNIILFGQDWGGLIGLRILAENQDLFAGMVLSNTSLPVGQGGSAGFDQWLEFSQNIPDFNAGKIVNQGSLSQLSDETVAAYNAPFPDDTYKAGARAFPTLVPITPEHDQVEENKSAWKLLQEFNKPTITAFGEHDPIFLGAEKKLIEMIPGAEGAEHIIIDAGHFSQENQPELLVDAILSIE